MSFRRGQEPPAGQEQRRALFRVEPPMVLTCTVRSSASSAPPATVEAAIVNVSAGGMLLATEALWALGEVVAVEVHLPQALVAKLRSCRATGRILRIDQPGEGRTRKTRVAVVFLFPNELDRDVWVRLVFELERLR